MAGAARALLLQGGFAFLFLYSMPNFRPPQDLGRELTLILRPMPKPVFLPAAPPARSGPQLPVIQNAPEAVAPMAPTAPPSAAVPGLSTFGQALNGCTPEKYSSLPPDQQARCPRPGAGVAMLDVPDLMGSPSHVKDEAYWQAEFAREKSQLLLPCVTAIGSAPAINFLCVGALIANGTITDPHTWPIYETKKFAPGDFYKVEQAYDAWHKEHPVKAAQR